MSFVIFITGLMIVFMLYAGFDYIGTKIDKLMKLMEDKK